MKSAVVLVTGAAGAIGSAIVSALHNAGWSVIGLDLKFKDPQDELMQFVELDLTDSAQLKKVLSDLKHSHYIQAVVNCAAIVKVGHFIDQDENYWQDLVNVNLFAPLVICHALLPDMISQQNGQIINITSDSSRTGAAGEAVYSGTKGALVSFSKSLAQEVGRHGIRVNCVSPGVVDTPLIAPNIELVSKLKRKIPLKRLASPADIANMVSFLLSPQADYITGQIMSVDGGLTMAD